MADKLQEAKTYADGIKTDLLGSASEGYDTFKEIEALITSQAEQLQAIASVAKKYVTEIGDDVALEHTVSHNLNSRDVVVQLRTSKAPYEAVLADIEFVDENSLKVRTASPISSVQPLTVVVVG